MDLTEGRINIVPVPTHLKTMEQRSSKMAFSKVMRVRLFTTLRESCRLMAVSLSRMGIL